MKKIIVFDNPDKDEKPTFIKLICAPPNSGKTLWIKNFLVKEYTEDNKYDKILLFHADIDSKEYDDIDTIKYDKCPTIEDVKEQCENNENHCLLIIEDIITSKLSKKELIDIESLFKYCSHLNTDIIITCHNPFSTSPNLRRLANTCVLFRYHDQNVYSLLERLFGLKKGFLKGFFGQMNESNKHDSIHIKLSEPIAYKNLYEKINLC